LPLVDTTVSGAGTVNDGASRIGLAAFGSWAGGTLRAFLVTIEAIVADALLKTGDTITGPVIIGSGGAIDYRPIVDLPDANTLLTLGSSFYKVTGGHAASRTYTLPNPPRAGMWLVIFKSDGASGPNDAFAVERVDTSVIGDYTAATSYGSITFISMDVGGTLKWIGVNGTGSGVGYS
jgi:hypothetical protein